MGFLGLSTLALVWQPRHFFYLPVVVLVGIFIVAIYNTFLHPLAGIPGPCIAGVSRLWYVRNVARGDFDKVVRRLHERYGPLVRIAPNEVSVSDPEAISTIYSIKSKFTKNEFYPPWRPTGFDTKHADQFTDTDEVHHSNRRKLLSNTYSMSSILESETYIDHCTSRRAKHGELKS